MRKRSLWITVLMIIFSFCLTMGLTACSDDDGDGKKSGPLEKITVIVDKTEVDIGETINLSFSTTPENPTSAHDGSSYKASCIEFYVRINGVDSLVDKRNPTATYTVSSGAELGFYVKYCNHYSSHSDLNGDLMSEIVTVRTTVETISTVEELKAIANTNKSYILANNIDISSETNCTPIEGFSGKLSGGGYSITNLTISAVNVENIGLFGTLQGTVQDLKIENAQITARGDAGKAGIVAGTNKGTISNVSVNGNIAPEYYNNVGGLVGYNDCGSIVNCINQATVIGANSVGGIVGNMLVNKNEAITGCKNEGIITGKDNVGGIAGYLTCAQQKSNPTYSISNHINDNTVTGVNRVGGIFGEVYGMDYYASYTQYYGYFEMSVFTNSAEITGSSTGNDTGGLIGKATRLNLMTTCENKGDVSGGTCVGGFVGYAPGTNIKATGAENANTITGKGKVGGFAGHAGVIENAINNGDIVSTGVLVENGNSRAYVGGVAGFSTGIIGCENNVDIKIETNGSFVGGIVGYVEVSANNRVNNNVNYGSIIGKDNVGGIAGYLTCSQQKSNPTYSVSNNENRNTVTGDNRVGGIFGEVYGMDYYASYTQYYGYFEMSVFTNTAEITGSSTGNDTGGLIGKATRIKVMTTCDNTADVSGGNCVGGFVGYAPDTNIKATGTSNNNIISGKYKVGGFAGQAGLIEYAINSGEIVSIGTSESGEAFIGGIAGYCTGAIGCVNNIDIEIDNAGKYVGGIAGYIIVSSSNMVNDNENYGAIVAKDYVGGIAGYITCVKSKSNPTYTISNNKNKNTVTGNNKVGGIFGEVYGMDNYASYTQYYGYFEVINCVNESEIVGTSYVGGIVGAYTRLKTDSNVMDTNTTLYGDKLGQ